MGEGISAASNEGHYPELVRQLSDAWRHYVASYSEASQTVVELRQAAYKAGLPGGQMWSWNPDEQGLKALVESALDCMIHEAARIYCGGDMKVMPASWVETVKKAEIEKSIKGSADFKKFWMVMSDRYGNGKGDEEAKRRAAVELNPLLRIIPRKQVICPKMEEEYAPKVVKNGIRFRLRALIERNYSGTYSINYDAHRYLGNLHSLLVRVAGSEFPPAELANRFRDSKGNVDLPLRLDVGTWQLTCNKDKSYLWLPMDDALHLRSLLEEALNDE